MPDDEVAGLLASIRALLRQESRLVLAVSGGRDSMTLLDAVARERTPSHLVVVATVDHGTGPWASEAAAMVMAEASRRGLPVRSALLAARVAAEAAWREVRWRFLRSVAERERAVIVTAHTRDDQVETVVMRLLRGAGARGLAGLLAPSDIRRPLLAHPRSAIERYVRERGVAFVDDPSNRSRSYLRNRVRLDILPALRRVHPGFEAELLHLAERAATIRRALDDVAATLVTPPGPGQGWAIDAGALAPLDDASLRALWPAFAGRAGVVLDRRGTERMARFTREARIGARAPVSGGFEVVRERQVFRLRRVVPTLSEEEIPLARDLRFGPFRFEVVPGGTSFLESVGDPWQVVLPQDARLAVRAWEPGDRMDLDATGRRRRVKRFFADAGIAGPLREGWPVVLVNGQIEWIPGVRRSRVRGAPPAGRSVLVRCERA
jgi:tRNA(Ile)-lysidine synthase